MERWLDIYEQKRDRSVGLKGAVTITVNPKAAANDFNPKNQKTWKAHNLILINCSFLLFD